MELFQVSDGCPPNSKDSKTKVLFTWEQMWCCNHHEQQPRSLGHVIGPIQILTLQKVLSLSEVNLQHDSHLFDITVNPMFLYFLPGADLRSNSCPFIPEELGFPQRAAQAHLDLPSAWALASFPALSEGFLFPYPSSLTVGWSFLWSFSPFLNFILSLNFTKLY